MFTGLNSPPSAATVRSPLPPDSRRNKGPSGAASSLLTIQGRMHDAAVGEHRVADGVGSQGGLKR